MMTAEERLERRQNTFVWPHLQRKEAVKNWPAADVLNTMALNEFVPQMCRLPYDYLYRDDPVAMAETSLLVHEWLDIDSIAASHDGYSFDVEAMGGKIRFFPNHSPDIDRTDQFVKSADDLEKVRFRGIDTGRYPYLIECYQAVERYVGLNLYPSTCGPWSLACNLYGGENILVAALTDPDFVHELLDRVIADVLTPTVRALKEALPSAKRVNFADAWATPPFLTADMYREFIIPHYAKWAELMAPDFTIGGCGVRMSGLKKEDQEFFWAESIRARGSVQANEPDLSVFGAEWFREEADSANKSLSMLTSPSFIQLATPEEAAQRAKYLCLAGKKGKTPCTVGIGNSGGNPPLINLFTFIEACKTYGAVDANEDTPFEIPYNFQPFEEFLKGKLANNVEGYTFDWLSKSGYSHLKR